MAAFVSANNPADRLTEVLAGSTAILSNPTDILSSSALPGLDSIDLNDVLADASSSATQANAGAIADLPLLGEILGGGGEASSVIADIVGSGGQALPILSGVTNGDVTGAGIPSLDLTGQGALLQPVFNDVNHTVSEVNNELQLLGNEIGLGNAVTDVIRIDQGAGLANIGMAPHPDASEGLVGTVLNAPSQILSGNIGEAVSDIAADVLCVVNAVTGLKDTLLFGHGDPTNPIPELLSGIGDALQHVPLLTINGGNNDQNGGLLGGIIGDLTHSSSGHLIDVDAGPEQSHGLVLDLLSRPEPGPHNAVEVNAVDVGPTGPHVADVGILTGVTDGLNIPLLNGAGTDGLTGNLLGDGGLLSTGNVLSGNSTSAPATALVDVTTVVHDLLPASLIADHGILDTHGTHIL